MVVAITTHHSPFAIRGMTYAERKILGRQSGAEPRGA
jgi:hypothetical protein